MPPDTSEKLLKNDFRQGTDMASQAAESAMVYQRERDTLLWVFSIGLFLGHNFSLCSNTH